MGSVQYYLTCKTYVDSIWFVGLSTAGSTLFSTPVFQNNNNNNFIKNTIPRFMYFVV